MHIRTPSKDEKLIVNQRVENVILHPVLDLVIATCSVLSQDIVILVVILSISVGARLAILHYYKCCCCCRFWIPFVFFGIWLYIQYITKM